MCVCMPCFLIKYLFSFFIEYNNDTIPQILPFCCCVVLFCFETGSCYMAQTDLNLNPLLFLPQKGRDKSVSHQADFILLLLWEVALGSRRNKKMCPQESASITAISSRSKEDPDQRIRQSGGRFP